jgi:thiol:disulfide interchange protein
VVRVADRRKSIVTKLLLLALALPLFGQRLDPIHWSMTVEPARAAPGAHVLARVAAKIDPSWHLYSPTTPKGGPIPTTLALAPNPAVDSVTIFEPKPGRRLDPNFGLETETYENEAVFLFDIQLKKDAAPGPLELSAYVRYQTCNDRMCLPPVNRTAAASITVDPATVAAPAAIPAGYQKADAPAVPAPVAPPEQSQGTAAFLLVAFGFGLAAIFTPCVFPMIPITVSFFLSQGKKTRGESVFQAIVFSLGIIVLFSALGLVTTAILGPFGVIQLGSNPWVNGFIALVFVVFGLSLLGAFEITIPSGILTKLDSASRKGGIAGTLLMGLTFSLSAFACVGPFVGTLLASSVQAGGLRPLAGMVSFAVGLALPFFLLAMFPAWLQRLPKSGGWMMRVKVVLGFVILAAALKYLTNVDQVLRWNLITRERFLAVWIVLFSLAGLYLLGFLRLEGIKPEEHLGLWRLFIGAGFLVFALSLVPGMFGARLGDLDAYVPAPSGTGMLGTAAAGEKLPWMTNQYREALATAREEHKLVFVNFTGYACTNCHWMRSNMFTRPEIEAALQKFVLVELYTDGTDAASQENQQLQQSKFGTIAIPFYAILDPDEKVIATFPGLTRNAEEFSTFLGSR